MNRKKTEARDTYNKLAKELSALETNLKRDAEDQNMQYRQEWQLEKDVLSALETDSGEMNTSVNVESVIQKLPDSNQENDFAGEQELEKQAGLIERKRQGLGRPNLIYVKNFAATINDKSCEKGDS